MTTWHPTTPPWYRDAAERVCTPKQLEVLRLASHELTDQQIASRLHLTRQAVQSRRTLANCRLEATPEALEVWRSHHWEPPNVPLNRMDAA